MKVIVIALIMAFALTACTTEPKPILTKTVYKTVHIPASVLVCRGVRVPAPENMTNQQLAEYLVRLVRANRLCKNNMDTIKRIIKQTKDLTNPQLKVK
jgi:starvation-inducible outer membrane lipoprotein